LALDPICMAALQKVHRSVSDDFRIAKILRTGVADEPKPKPAPVVQVVHPPPPPPAPILVQPQPAPQPVSSGEVTLERIYSAQKDMAQAMKVLFQSVEELNQKIDALTSKE